MLVSRAGFDFVVACRPSRRLLTTLGSKAAQLQRRRRGRRRATTGSVAGKLGRWLPALGLSSLAFFEDSVLYALSAKCRY